MGRGFGSTAPTVALIAAISLLWVFPFCLFHQAGTATYRFVTPTQSDHGSSPPAICGAHLFHAAVTGQETGADARVGLSIRISPPSTILCERLWVVRRLALSGASLPGLPAALPSSSNKLYSLYAVYQI